MSTRTKTQSTGLAAEREQAAALRGRHDERYAREAQERAEAEKSRQAAFAKTDERIAEVERLAGLLRADRDRQRAKVRGLERDRKAFSLRLRSNIEVARERLSEFAEAPYSDEFREWLRRLPVAAEPTPPPVEALMSYVLGKDKGFRDFLLSEVEAITNEGTVDPRGREEIRAELERVESDLAEASAELDRRERAAQVAGHAIKAAEVNATAAVDAFLAEYGGQR